MGMHVGIQEGKERELGNRFDVIQGRNSPAGNPIPITGGVG